MMTNNLMTDGLIIKQSNYKESDRMLTIFTPEYGIIQAAARGVRKIKNCRAASAQLFCYSDFELYTGGGDIALINNSSIKDAFYPISEDITLLALFTYLADITISALGCYNPDANIMNLFLNSLYAAAYKNTKPQKIKPVFEMRLMSGCGLMPDIRQCSRCGKTENLNFFSISDAAVCQNCRINPDLSISPDAYAGLYYILFSASKKIYSFNASEEVLDEISSLSEKYIIHHLEKKFSSLEYYKKILR